MEVVPVRHMPRTRMRMGFLRVRSSWSIRRLGMVVTFEISGGEVVLTGVFEPGGPILDGVMCG